MYDLHTCSWHVLSSKTVPVNAIYACPIISSHTVYIHCLTVCSSIAIASNACLWNFTHFLSCYSHSQPHKGSLVMWPHWRMIDRFNLAFHTLTVVGVTLCIMQTTAVDLFSWMGICHHSQEVGVLQVAAVRKTAWLVVSMLDSNKKACCLHLGDLSCVNCTRFAWSDEYGTTIIQFLFITIVFTQLTRKIVYCTFMAVHFDRPTTSML